MNIRPTLLIMLTFLVFSSGAISKAGQPTQSHASIIQAVEQFLESQQEITQYSKYTIKVGHLDSRLR